jgi:hypothetical protein
VTVVFLKQGPGSRVLLLIKDGFARGVSVIDGLWVDNQVLPIRDDAPRHDRN